MLHVALVNYSEFDLRCCFLCVYSCPLRFKMYFDFRVVSSEPSISYLLSLAPFSLISVSVLFWLSNLGVRSLLSFFFSSYWVVMNVVCMFYKFSAM